jgi:thiosulfate/3-mercaptopyruvate sulfurtransferase
MRSCRIVLFVRGIALGAPWVPAQARSGAQIARGWPNGKLLVETSWVALHGSDAGVRLVDLRDAAAYAAGHIPGAVRLDEGPLRNPEDRLTYLPAPAAFAALMEQTGIGNGTHVVAYDDQGGKMAARLWYVLNAYGHERVSLLNGGWSQWVAEKRTVSTEAPSVPHATFVPRAQPQLSCPAPELLARAKGVVVLDARSPEEFRGETLSPGATKAGRIPGAVNVEWKENVTGPTHLFKPAAELRKLYESKGVTPDKEIVTSCAGGGRAAHTLFALKLLGYPKVRIYYGSFSDYTSRPEAPVEK